MGSEHSAQLQQQQQAGGAEGAGGALRAGSLHRHSTSTTAASSRAGLGGANAAGKLQRGNTIAVTGGIGSVNAGGVGGAGGVLDDGYSTSSATPSSAYICDSRPVSPPMSVCSDSDLPYISYTDKPIGDSPKLRNKQQTKQVKSRPNSAIIMNRSSQQQQHHHYPLQQHSQPFDGGRSAGVAVGGRARPVSASGAHSIVVVKSAATKDIGIEKDDDIVRLQVGAFVARSAIGFDGQVFIGCEPKVDTVEESFCGAMRSENRARGCKQAGHPFASVVEGCRWSSGVTLTSFPLLHIWVGEDVT